MPRSMSNAMLSAIQASQVNPAVFVEMHFRSGISYIWSGVGNYVWNGQTWLGVGNLGSISTIEDGTNVEAKGITLSLSGINNAMLADALQELQLGLPCIVYLALFSSPGGSLIADPIVAWAGRMDQPTIDVGGESATISIACENRLLDMNVGYERRYTQDDAQMDFSGDLGFQFVNSLVSVNLYWGRVPAAGNV